MSIFKNFAKVNRERIWRFFVLAKIGNTVRFNNSLMYRVYMSKKGDGNKDLLFI